MSRENSSLSENILVLALSLHYLNITQLPQILHQPFSLLSWRRPRTSWSACVLYRSWRVGSKSLIVSLGEGCPEPDRLGRGVPAGKGCLGGRSALGEGCPRGSNMRRLPKKRFYRWGFLFKPGPLLRECRNRSENLINRKNTKFYFEAVPQNFFQLRQKYFFEVEVPKNQDLKFLGLL